MGTSDCQAAVEGGRMRGHAGGAACYAAVIVSLACLCVHAEDAGTVAQQRMDAQAAEMLAAEERNEEQIHKEAVTSHHSAEDQVHNDLGESEEVADDSPPPPWVAEERARKAAQRTKKEEQGIEAAMTKYD